jgi:2-dehydro-3-deoxyphosphogluconate aldolase/(4S)-4-hydroxy-2-oxoglutarate aldolase
MTVPEVENVGEIMRLAPVIPVLTIEDPADAVPLAETLVAAGLPVLEVTLRTEKALEVIARMTGVEGAVVGAGTVLDAADAVHAVGAGAAFLVSPGLSEVLVAAAEELATPLLPGVATAGEIMRGLDLGLIHFKFFPAETSGGAAAVKAFAGPFPHVMFCPTGGIRAKTAADYLTLPNVLCVGGTWIAPRDLLAEKAWDRIGELARHAAGLPRSGRP